MEFSFDNERERATAPNNIGSDRLRKAIERNRAKQTKRAGQADRVSRPQSTMASSEDWSLPGRGSSKPTSSSARRGTRKSVGSADNVEFTTAIRKGSRAPAPVNYSEAKTPTVVTRKVTRKPPTKTRKPKSKFLKNTNEYVVKGIWVFCAILLLRLVFSNGGVSDYYDKKEVLNSRFDELARIEIENKGLLKEIGQLKKDPQYQKKVVRDHLGYIAKDEFLILFPENIN